MPSGRSTHCETELVSKVWIDPCVFDYEADGLNKMSGVVDVGPLLLLLFDERDHALLDILEVMPEIRLGRHGMY